MSFIYKRISSLGTSHDTSVYMAVIGFTSSTQTRKSLSQ